MNIFFTADTHFYHTNVIKYCNRPFNNTDEMNEVLIKNWNDTVGPDDHIYHLGDVAFSNGDKASAILDRLKGKKFLILGNHDRTKIVKKINHHFEWVKDVYLLTVQDKTAPQGKNFMWLSHYAHRVWPHGNHGAWNLYGHSHGALSVDKDSLALDVGVDCHNLKPIAYEDVRTLMVDKVPF